MMKKVLKKIPNILLGIVTLILALIVIFNFACFVKRARGEQCPTVFGLGSAVVISGSMEPNISINDLVIILKRDSYEVGEVVTYKGNTTPVTHRIIEKGEDENGLYYVTQGDNKETNNTDDGKIYAHRIVGKVILAIPRVGEMHAFFGTPGGFILLTVVMLIVAFFPDIKNFVVATYKKLAQKDDKITAAPDESDASEDSDDADVS